MYCMFIIYMFVYFAHRQILGFLVIHIDCLLTTGFHLTHHFNFTCIKNNAIFIHDNNFMLCMFKYILHLTDLDLTIYNDNYCIFVLIMGIFLDYINYKLPP